MERPDSGGRSTVYGTAGAVACEHPLAALAGIRMLDAGGTAADACVAMAAAMAVLSPMMTGPGGDAFLLYREAETGRVLALEGAGRAGRGATVEAMRARGHADMPVRGGETITVPGAVALWGDAAAELGRLGLAALLEPARELAERGFPVAAVTARMWRDAEPLLRRDAAAAEAFLPGGRAPREGELVRLGDLGHTLGTLAEQGPRAFYEGELAERIVAATRATGGFLELEDMAAHRSTWVDPISAGYRGLQVLELPPPTTGIAALMILGALEREDLGALPPLSAERMHLEVQAKRHAFAALHEFVGDPDFVDVPVEAMLAGAATAAEERAPAGRGAGDTTYLCAVDADGNACSLINSLYTGFGNGIVAPGTGVCLHNRGLGFSLDESSPSVLAPGKRPLHTIIPALVTQDGALWAVYGNMGGYMQPQGHAQVLVNLRDHGMPPQEAIDHPRHFHDQGVLLVEGRVPAAEVDKLRRWGHDVEVGPDYAGPCGGAQAIRVHEDGVRAAGSDPRKDGCALVQ
ncbi:MAG TPA: gamma-glutamyltransferase family protein [Solirubrobacteraceae bacterium]|nr:gamma-glutamyltransferase family protein [Solirubrobacteraceae bacterium]